MSRKIVVTDYDEMWAQKYLEEEGRLQVLLKNELIQSFHIGSTSVPFLRAKPTIDILLVVHNIEKLDSFSKQFEDLGYESLGQYGITGRRFYCKGSETRTHHIHAFQYDNIKEIERHLLYRDYLRTHQESHENYANLKSILAAKYPDNSEKYSQGKDKLVKEIENLAIKWHWATRLDRL